MYFQIRYISHSGAIESTTVQADTELEARALCQAPASRIVSVKKDSFAHLKEELLSPPPNDLEQAVFLQNLASLLLSGEDVTRAIRRLLIGNVSLKYDKEKVAQCITCVDYLRALRFNTLAVTLAEVGEKSSSLGQTLQVAAENMLDREKLMRQLGKSIWQSSVYVLMGIVLLFGVPVVLGGTLETIMKDAGKAFQANSWTYFILYMHSFLLSSWWAVLGAFVLIGVFREPLWDMLKNKTGFNLIRDYILLKRALLFLSAYKPLYQSGIPDSRSMLLIKTQAPQQEAKIYDTMYYSLVRGRDLAQVINTPHWPLNLRFSMANFGSLQDDKRKILIDTLITTTRHQIDVISQRIAKLVTFISWVFIITGITSIAIGYYLPMASIRATFS